MDWQDFPDENESKYVSIRRYIHLWNSEVTRVRYNEK